MASSNSPTRVRVQPVPSQSKQQVSKRTGSSSPPPSVRAPRSSSIFPPPRSNILTSSPNEPSSQPGSPTKLKKKQRTNTHKDLPTIKPPELTTSPTLPTREPKRPECSPSSTAESSVPSHKPMPSSASSIALAALVNDSARPLSARSPPMSQSTESLRSTLSVAAPAETPNLHTRSVSTPIKSRSTSNILDVNAKVSRGRSWLPGAGAKVRPRNTSQDLQQNDHRSPAWINAGDNKIDYNLALLINGEKVPELWNESGDLLVYLFPESSGRTPSFRVPSVVIASSQALIASLDNGLAGRLRGSSFDGRGNLAVEDAARHLAGHMGSPPVSPMLTPEYSTKASSKGSGDSIRSFGEAPREVALYFPCKLTSSGSSFTPQDIQSLVDARNLFAFLTGQPLVGTRIYPSAYKILLSIASMLKQHGFTNIDGSTYGEAASSSFSFYVDDFQLANCTLSKEKTIEGVILGEAMRSQELFNETFAHAVGKYHALTDLKTSLFNQISTDTRHRLERASLDLSLRQKSIFVRLNEFDFPSLFAGFANSTSSSESKTIRFRAWKTSYVNLRRAVLNYYKHLHGQWPPKASSRKNNFVESGLNRLVLKGLYSDLCSLYDLLADRDSITTRSYDEVPDDPDSIESNQRAAALRRILAEYDQASPPVQPPVPFDTPRIPTMAAIEPKYPFLSPKDQHKASSRKLQPYETLLLLAKSHNLDSDLKLPFLEMYKNFEAREARGCSAREMDDQRHGHWLFMYAALQALPMLVVDAPGLRFTSGVEYFLCEPPLGNLPWMEDATGVKMAWYGIQGSQGVVSLPSDVVNHGVEAIYRRSHCWVRAEQWISAAETESMAPPSAADIIADEVMSPLDPPPGFADGELRPPSTGTYERSASADSVDRPRSRGKQAERNGRQAKRNSIALGLERLPIPQGFEDSYNSVGTPVSRGRYSPQNFSRNTSRNTSRNPSPAPPGNRVSSVGSQPGTPTSESQAGSTRKSPAYGPYSGGNRGSTFDDILGGLDLNGKKKR